MDKAEARKILQRKIEDLQSRGFKALCEFVDAPQTFKTMGQFGAWYHLKVSVVWDDKSPKALRVTVVIDDGQGWRIPMTESFIITPSGSV